MDQVKKTVSRVKNINYILQNFSIPLLFGVILAVVIANQNYSFYENFIHYDFLNGTKFLGHKITLHFLVNDIFMVFFFGIAAVEIANSMVKGGPLNPIKKAINPIAGTLGGVIVPVAVFFLFNLFDYQSLNLFDRKDILNGWAIPTATDIALAWLVARIVFGKSHPAISYLLLLAVGDDAIGLIIIAIFYPSAEFPVEPMFLFINFVAILIAYILRKRDVRNIVWYLVLAGIPSWLGLILAHLHPALAFVPIILLLPSDKKNSESYSPLNKFEHTFQYPVDMGLFFFSLVNAGVVFADINALTYIILLSLLLGKTIGIFSFSMIAHKAGYKLPTKIHAKELCLIGLIASLGLTVALFVAGEAYSNLSLQRSAKMGALLSLVAFPLAIISASILKIKKEKD